MWNKIEEVDLFIIEEFEKVTHFIQRNTSVDNFDLIYILAGFFSLSPFYYADSFKKSIVLFFLFWIFAYYFGTDVSCRMLNSLQVNKKSSSSYQKAF
jgi:hypothetical protein